MLLQDDRGGGRVKPPAAAAPVLLPQRQPALGLPARQPLVLQPDWQRDPAPERRDERLHAGGLLVGAAVERQRPADHDRGQAVRLGGEPLDHPGHHRHAGGEPAARRQRVERRGQRTGAVAEGEADAALAQIDAESARPVGRGGSGAGAGRVQRGVLHR